MRIRHSSGRPERGEIVTSLDRRRGLCDPECAGARLQLAAGAEDLLREWLNPPQVEPYRKI